DVLLPWWIKAKEKRQVYIGLGLYRMVHATKGPWQGTAEILKQIRMARAARADGLVFYSISNFNKIGSALQDSLRHRYFGSIAFPPTMPWIDNQPPPPPQLFATQKPDGMLL